MSTATPFAITQLTGPKSKLELKGRAGPYQGYELGGVMRAQVTWYAGVPTGTIQFLGPQENKSTIRGMWKEKFLTETAYFSSGGAKGTPATAIETPPQLVEVVDEMRRQGQLVKVEWGGFKRVGYIAEFKAVFQRLEDVEWEMSFEWIGQEEGYATDPVRKANAANSIDSLSEAARRLSSALQNNVLVSTLTNYSQQLLSLEQQIVDAIDTMSDTVSNIAAGIVPNQDGIRSVLGAFKNLSSLGDTMSQAASSKPAWEVSKGSNKPLLTSSDYASVQSYGLSGQTTQPSNAQAAAAAQSQFQLAKAARDLRYRAARQKEDLLPQLRPDLLAVFVARENQDLRDVSTLYYGVPEDWKYLKEFNGLATSKLEAGQVVFVPNRKVT